MKDTLEVEGFVTIEKHPRPRFDCIGIVDGAADEAGRLCHYARGWDGGPNASLGEPHGAPWGSRFGNTGTTRRRDQGSGQHGTIVKESTPTG